MRKTLTAIVLLSITLVSIILVSTVGYVRPCKQQMLPPFYGPYGFQVVCR